MTEEKIKEIQLDKGGTLTREFIQQYDDEWNNAVQTIRSTAVDLSKILIVGR